MCASQARRLPEDEIQIAGNVSAGASPVHRLVEAQAEFAAATTSSEFAVTLDRVDDAGCRVAQRRDGDDVFKSASVGDDQRRCSSRGLWIELWARYASSVLTLIRAASDTSASS